MARVHIVKKARKDYPEAGIKKGDTYYWWEFRFGGRHKSKTMPSRSQLTQSSFLQTLYDLEDQISALQASDADELQSTRDDVVDQIRQLRDECQDSLDNMPDHLQDTSESGMLLTERIDALESWADELESVDTEIEEVDSEEQDSDYDEEQARQERIDEIISEIQDISHSVP